MNAALAPGARTPAKVSRWSALKAAASRWVELGASRDPGVQTIRRLSPGLRQVLVCIAFLLPSTLLWMRYWDGAQQTIAFAQKERQGLVALRDALGLAHDLAASRMQIDPAQDAPADVRIAARLARLQDLTARGALSLDPAFMQRAVSAVRAMADADRAQRNLSIASLQRQLRDAILQLGGTSNLVLDPDLASLHLVNAAILAMPEAAEQLSVLIAVRTPADTATGSGAVEATATNLSSYLWQAVAAEPFALGGLDTRAVDRLLAYARSVDAVTAAQSDKAIALVTDLQHLSASVVDATDDLIARRIVAVRRDVAITALLALACFALAFYLFRGFYIASVGEQRSVERSRAASARALERLAWEDVLTGLPNRAAIKAHVARLAAAPDGAPFSLAMIELEGLGIAQDADGQEAADAALTEIADRLRATAIGFVGRWGERAFVVTNREPLGADACRARMLALRTSIAASVVLDGIGFRVTPFVGVVRYPDHGADATVLMDCADAALRAARTDPTGLVMFEPPMREQLIRRAKLAALLREALGGNGELTHVLQSKYDAARRLVGAELLSRWTSPRFGPVSPVEFVPIAEQGGFVCELGRIALDGAAAAAAAAATRGNAVPISVNVAPAQLLNEDFVDVIAAVCRRHGVSPGMLELELTESALIQDVATTERLLHRLRALGCVLSLDDFGTGYSSLSYLRRLPFHKVKIDRSFVSGVEVSEAARQVLLGIVQMCHGLGMRTVAEGVETAEQFGILRDVGVDEFQGFLFARPQPVARWLDNPGPQGAVAPSSAVPDGAIAIV